MKQSIFTVNEEVPEVINFIRVRSRNPFRINYMYLDISAYLADRIFVRHKLPVKFFDQEFGREGSDVRFIYCSIRKKNSAAFEKCMEELCDTAALMGYTDYAAACEGLERILNESEYSRVPEGNAATA